MQVNVSILFQFLAWNPEEVFEGVVVKVIHSNSQDITVELLSEDLLNLRPEDK